MNSLTPENTRLGFIGMGSMGSRMAKRLLDHGYQTIVYNRTRETAESLTKFGARVAASIAELASAANVIISSLTNDHVVNSVYTGPEGVLAHAHSGAVIIEMSTVSPSTSRKLYDLSSAVAIEFLDSPVSGSTPAAEEGTLVVFCGGDEEAFQAAQPIFSSIARQSFYLGGAGSGNAMKLVANTLLGVGMQAIAESLALGQKEGLDRHRLLGVLAQTAVIAPAHLGKLSRADGGDYSPQFPIRLMNKDFGLVLETAAAARVPMPAAATAFQMNMAQTGRDAEEDFSAVIKLMERLAGLNS